MREILYRGLHRRKGEKVRLDGTPVESKWVYGGVCQYNEERAIIYQTEPEIAKFPVYAETVGQFTGLTDKNGVKIFEGDIISVRYEENPDYAYGVPKKVWFEQFEVYFDNEHHCWYARHIIDKEDAYWLYEFDEECTVIDNIHDNPELLGVGDKNELDRRRPNQI